MIFFLFLTFIKPLGLDTSYFVGTSVTIWMLVIHSVVATSYKDASYR